MRAVTADAQMGRLGHRATIKKKGPEKRALVATASPGLARASQGSEPVSEERAGAEGEMRPPQRSSQLLPASPAALSVALQKRSRSFRSEASAKAVEDRGPGTGSRRNGGRGAGANGGGNAGGGGGGSGSSVYSEVSAFDECERPSDLPPLFERDAIVNWLVRATELLRLRRQDDETRDPAVAHSHPTAAAPSQTADSSNTHSIIVDSIIVESDIADIEDPDVVNVSPIKPINPIKTINPINPNNSINPTATADGRLKDRGGWRESMRHALVTGERGSGRTSVGLAVAARLPPPVAFFHVDGRRLLSSKDTSAELERLLSIVQERAPSFLFLDNIDFFLPCGGGVSGEGASASFSNQNAGGASNGESQSQSGTSLSRVRASQKRLLHCEHFLRLLSSARGSVFCLATAESAESVDAELLGSGLFMQPPKSCLNATLEPENQLRLLRRFLRLPEGEWPGKEEWDWRRLRGLLSDWKPAQLSALCQDAIMRAAVASVGLSSRYCGSEEVAMEHLTEAYEARRAFVTKEGFVETPDVTMDDIGGYEREKDIAMRSIVSRIRNAEVYSRARLREPSALLLYGPPGCGKTLMAKALANEAGAKFIAVASSELLNKWLGESERNVRQIFARARSNAPCVIFFDEFDALAVSRDDESQHASSKRIVNCLLTEMDGVRGREGVYVIAATNRKDSLDRAMLRSGRIETFLKLSPPNSAARRDITGKILRSRGWSLHESHLLNELVERTKGLSGANLRQILVDAAQYALDRLLKEREVLAEETEPAKPSPYMGALVDEGNIELELRSEDIWAAYQCVALQARELGSNEEPEDDIEEDRDTSNSASYSEPELKRARTCATEASSSSVPDQSRVEPTL